VSHRGRAAHPDHLDWHVHLDEPIEDLAARLAAVLRGRVALVGVGNDLCGDDGAGLAVATALKAALDARAQPPPGDAPAASDAPQSALSLSVFCAGGVPENYLMKIARGRPDVVVLVDATDFAGDMPAGTVALAASARVAGMGPSTHGPAPLAFLDLLDQIHPCTRLLLGIQPVQTQVGSPLSPPVAAAADRLVQAVLKVVACATSESSGC